MRRLSIHIRVTRATSAARRMDRQIAFAATLILFMTGCTGIHTTELAQSFDTSYSEDSSGITYFLPTNSVRIVFTNETIASEVTKAKKALEEAQSDKQKQEKLILDLEEGKKKAADKPEDLKKVEDLLKIAKLELVRLAEKAEKATAALKTAEKASPQILIEELPPVPDTTRAYRAYLNHGEMSDDTVTLKTSADGLLTSLDYRGSDQSGTVVQNLVKTAIEVGKLYARLQGVPIGGAQTATQAAAEAHQTCPALTEFSAKANPGLDPYYFEYTIDPSDRAQVASVNLRLLLTNIPYLFDIRPPDNHAGHSSIAPTLADKTAYGLLHRRSVPYDVVVYESTEHKNFLCIETFQKDITESERRLTRVFEYLEANRHYLPAVRSAQMSMPAGGAVAWLDLTPRPFVETHITAEFSAGQLTSVTATRPSEFVGFSEIPLNAVTAVGNAVGEIIDNVLPFQLKFTQDKTKLVEAQADLLKERKAYQDLIEGIQNGTYVPDDGAEGEQPESGP